MRAWLRVIQLGLALLGLMGFCAFAAPPSILLAEVYRDNIDVTQYLVSEKLDGVRAIWDGNTLRSRAGNTINAPAWFLAGLPSTPLDGELWMGRNKFEQVSAAVRREQPNDEEWHQICYMIFELPEAPGTFTKRAERIRELAQQAKVPWFQAIDQFSVEDRSALHRRMKEVVKAGGEGLMLHRADALYDTGRSDTLLKLKPWEDAEAFVVGHVPGKGKYDGLLGALLVRMPDGRAFSIGTGFTDAQRRNPPAIGATVTFRYRGLTNNGLPRFASFMRVREE